MTSEVAVLNKYAVALAADSAVTISTTDPSAPGGKVFNTANKLFTLSKRHPVGVMIYNSTELCAVPWEVTIKLARKQFKNESAATIADWCEKFFSFLDGNTALFPAERESQVIRNILGRYYHSVGFEKHKGQDKKVPRKNIKTKIDEHIKALEGLPYSDGFDDAFSKQVSQNYKALFDTTAAGAFNDQKLAGLKAQCRKVATLILVRVSNGLFVDSGLVVAGFGEDEVFPSYKAFSIDMTVLGRLKRRHVSAVAINENQQTNVTAFAQRKTVSTLIKGIHPDFQDIIENEAAKIIRGIPRELIEHITQLSRDEKDSYIDAAKAGEDAAIQQFKAKIEEVAQNEFVQKLVGAISVMPIGELATVAEVFIHLTQIKQRMSLETETVGGPIDVAVISKGDGFVWIKRKHYFDLGLNPGFVQNYYHDL